MPRKIRSIGLVRFVLYKLILRPVEGLLVLIYGRKQYQSVTTPI